MARFEWAFKDLFHTRQHVSLAVKELLQIQKNPNVTLQFSEAVKLFQSPYTVTSIWEKRDEAFDQNFTFDFQSPQYCALYKQDSKIFRKELTKEEFDLLTILVNGRPLLQALQGSSSKVATSLFTFLGTSGIVTALTPVLL